MNKKVVMTSRHAQVFEFLKANMPEEFSIKDLSQKNKLPSSTNCGALRFFEAQGLCKCNKIDRKIAVKLDLKAINEAVPVPKQKTLPSYRVCGLTKRTRQVLGLIILQAEQKNPFPKPNLNGKKIPASTICRAIKELQKQNIISVTETSDEKLIKLVDFERAKGILPDCSIQPQKDCNDLERVLI